MKQGHRESVENLVKLAHRDLQAPKVWLEAEGKWDQLADLDLKENKARPEMKVLKDVVVNKGREASWVKKENKESQESLGELETRGQEDPLDPLEKMEK